MSRLQSVPVEQAAGKIQDLYQAIQTQLGLVPNLYQGIANSPAALEGFLAMDKALRHGELRAAEREAIALVVSQAHECQYCLSAHSVLGKLAGMKENDVLDVRRGRPENPKLQALTRFVQVVLERKGHVPAGELEKIRGAGYGDSAITEAILVIAQTVFTNFFNHVHGTEIDFPLAQAI